MLLSVIKIPVVTLINGEKLPVTLTLVEVMKCKADICMYACDKNKLWGTSQDYCANILKRELDELTISTMYLSMYF